MRKFLKICTFVLIFMFLFSACEVKRGSLTVAILKVLDFDADTVFHVDSTPMEASPSYSLWWKDDATITVLAGTYYVGGKYLKLLGDTDWSWDLDTGTEQTSTWYYLYTYDNSGTPDHVASATPPTKRYNTGLSGSTYDVNQYLGAFYNNSSGHIDAFYMTGNKFVYTFEEGSDSHTGDANWTQIGLEVPASAIFATIKFYCIAGGVEYRDRVYYSIDGGTSTYMTQTCRHTDETANDVSDLSGDMVFDTPMPTAGAGWIKTDDNGFTVYVKTLGWIDKWL